MEDRNIEESVREVIEDLKNKVDSLNAVSADDDDSIAEKVEAIKNKAVKVFQDVSERLNTMSSSAVSEEELNKAIATIKERSKTLYENAIDKINELKGDSQEKEQSEDREEKDPFSEVKNGIENVLQDAKEGIDEFMNREDVKEAVDKAKVQAVDIAEKSLQILKKWLTPKGDDE